jgi:chitinase
MPYAAAGDAATLAALPPYYTHVALAFARPDLAYALSSLDLAGTGLEFSSPGAVVRDAVAALKRKNPGTRVLLALGGAEYADWSALNAPAAAALVADLGLDGVDVDFEPGDPQCAPAGAAGRVACASDAAYVAAVRALRAALPRPALLVAAGWSTGAYGDPGAWADAPPRYSPWTGLQLRMFEAAGRDLDMVAIMAYDATNAFQPEQAYAAYAAVYAGPLLLGLEVPPDVYGGAALTLPQAAARMAFVRAERGGGAMLWSIQKEPTDGGPSAEQISQLVCRELGLLDCACGLTCPAR